VVPLVSWDRAVCKVSRETWVLPVKWEFKVSLVFPEPSALWESRDLSVQRANLVPLVFVVPKERWALRVCVDLLVQQVLLVLSVFAERTVLKVQKGSKGQADRRVILVHRESKVILAQSDLRAHPVPLVCLE